MRRIVGLGAACLALAGQPSAANAQWAFKLAGGIGIPMGDAPNGNSISTYLNSGWTGQIGGAYRFPDKPFAFSLELGNTYNSFKDDFIVDGYQNVFAATVNFLLTPYHDLGYRGFIYYLIGGGGYYSRYVAINSVPSVPPPCWWEPCSVTVDSQTDNGFGVNGGVGVGYSVGPGTVFAEGRYHYAWTSGSATQYIPILLGYRFGW